MNGLNVEKAKGIRVKFVIVGDKEVGKTTIASNFTKETPHSNQSLGIDKYKAKYIKNDEIFVFEIVDIQSEGFLQQIKEEYNKANFVLVVFDLTNRESFLSINNWITHCNSSDNQNIEIILVGNKNDLIERRQVSQDEATRLAKTNKMKYYEISAMNKEGIEPIFKNAFNEFYGSIEDMFDLNDSNLIKISENMNIINFFNDNDVQCFCWC